MLDKLPICMGGGGGGVRNQSARGGEDYKSEDECIELLAVYSSNENNFFFCREKSV